MKQRIIWALAYLFLLGCGSKQKPPTNEIEPAPVYDDSIAADPFTPIFELLNQSRLGVFVFGNGLNLNSSDVFGDTMFPGIKVNVVFSDQTETIERLDPTSESFCGIEFKQSAKEEAGKPVYRLYLTSHFGSYDLSLTGTRVLKKAWAEPELSKEQAKALVKDKPWCAYYAYQVNYGTEFKTAITFNVGQMKTEARSFRRFAKTSPGLVIESENFEEVWNTAMSIRQIFMTSGASIGGFALSSNNGNGLESMTLWENRTPNEAQTIVDKVLGQQQGELAIEARIAHLLTEQWGGQRFLGLQHDLD